MMPSLLFEHESFVFVEPEFDHNDNQSEFFAGALFKFNNKIALKPFIKTLILWSVDKDGAASFGLDELSFGTSVIGRPLPWLRFAATVATANVFEPNQNVWSGFKANVNMIIVKPEDNVYFRTKIVNKPVFNKINDKAHITWISNQWETELYWGAFNKLGQNLNLGLYLNGSYANASKKNSLDSIGKMVDIHINEFSTGFYYSPAPLLNHKLLFTVDSLNQTNYLTSMDTFTVDLGLELKSEFHVNDLTFAAAYNPRLYRVNQTGQDTISHVFEISGYYKFGNVMSKFNPADFKVKKNNKKK